MVVGNVGDSRAILSRDGSAVDLTDDHKANRPDEIARIVNAGGFVVHSRVLGRLAVSRAIGDVAFKTGPAGLPMVTAVPEIIEASLCEKDEMIVLACDGLFDVMSSQLVVNFARQAMSDGSSPADIAKQLAEHALKLGSTDNISVVVVKVGDGVALGSIRRGPSGAASDTNAYSTNPFRRPTRNPFERAPAASSNTSAMAAAAAGDSGSGSDVGAGSSAGSSGSGSSGSGGGSGAPAVGVDSMLSAMRLGDDPVDEEEVASAVLSGVGVGGIGLGGGSSGAASGLNPFVPLRSVASTNAFNAGSSGSGFHSSLGGSPSLLGVAGASASGGSSSRRGSPSSGFGLGTSTSSSAGISGPASSRTVPTPTSLSSGGVVSTGVQMSAEEEEDLMDSIVSES